MSEAAQANLSEAASRLQDSGWGRGARIFGLIAAPIALIAIWVAPFANLSPEAHRLAAIMAAVVILWLTEAFPLPVTTLLGIIACLVTGVAAPVVVFRPLADPLVFLLIGSFMIIQAINAQSLDRWLALRVLTMPAIGTRAWPMIAAFGLVTVLISSFVSNTVTTAMMYVIGLSFIRHLERERLLEKRELYHFASLLMLMAAWGASVGGLATPIGTPPNLIGLAFIRESTGFSIPFHRWMMLCVPVVFVLFIFLAISLAPRVRFRTPDLKREVVESLTHNQWKVLAVALLTLTLWLAPAGAALLGESGGLSRWLTTHFAESAVALFGAGLLLIIPDGRGRTLLRMEHAMAIDWAIIFLYAGGFALGALALQTGLADAIGRSIATSVPVTGGFPLIAASTFAAMLVSETTSNTTSANMVVPIVIGVARAAGVDPIAPAFAATMASSLGFILPVSTPCNAIVYASGYVSLPMMMRRGIMLDLFGVAVISLAVHWSASLLK